MANKKVLISCALTGTAGNKGQTPEIPVSPKEIAEDTVKVVKAGAAMVHIHIHEPNGRPSMSTDIFKETFEEVKNACDRENLDPIINLTTSGGVYGDEIRQAHVKLLRPEVCSYDVGTFNWALGGTFENSSKFLVELAQTCREVGTKPEIEVFDYGMLGNASKLIELGALLKPAHFQFVLGVLGAMDGTVENLEYLVRRMPEGCTWSCTGIGPAHLPILLTGLALGADGIRVGLEDNLYLDRGVKGNNVKLVERAVKIAALANREAATPDEGREMLSITRHSLKEYKG